MPHPPCTWMLPFEDRWLSKTAVGKNVFLVFGSIMFNQHNHRLTSFPVPHKIALQQTVQYESPGRFSSPSGQCNFVVKNYLRNSPLYNCCCHFAQSCSTCHSQRSNYTEGVAWCMCSCLLSRDYVKHVSNYTPSGKKNKWLKKEGIYYPQKWLTVT